MKRFMVVLGILLTLVVVGCGGSVTSPLTEDPNGLGFALVTLVNNSGGVIYTPWMNSVVNTGSSTNASYVLEQVWFFDMLEPSGMALKSISNGGMVTCAVGLTNKHGVFTLEMRYDTGTYADTVYPISGLVTVSKFITDVTNNGHYTITIPTFSYLTR